ncbi:hypothetical protein, partial [Neisseria dentiae]|uniref:hypothetical protein n=1 Tax=Neisseria dentiae TaxID=194197 RepID=UPI0035A19893
AILRYFGLHGGAYRTGEAKNESQTFQTASATYKDYPACFRECSQKALRRYSWLKSASAALKMLARCSILLRFLPCICGFFLKKPLHKPSDYTP